MAIGVITWRRHRRYTLYRKLITSLLSSSLWRAMSRHAVGRQHWPTISGALSAGIRDGQWQASLFTQHVSHYHTPITQAVYTNSVGCHYYQRSYITPDVYCRPPLLLAIRLSVMALFVVAHARIRYCRSYDIEIIPSVYSAANITYVVGGMGCIMVAITAVVTASYSIAMAKYHGVTIPLAVISVLTHAVIFTGFVTTTIMAMAECW